MNTFLRYLHDQVMGSLRAGKDWKSADTAVGRGASKLFAGALFILAIALAVVPMFLDFLPARIALRALVVSIMVFGLGTRFWRGNSVFAMLAGMVHYWIPTSLFIYMYYVVGKMAINLVRGGESNDYAFHGGIMIMTMGFLGCVTSWIQAGVLTEKAKVDGTSNRVAAFALRFYALVWVAFFFGGAFMLAWATGLAEWFFVDVLRW